MTAIDPPAPEGVRLPWSDVPERVRAAFEAWWGRSVAAAESQPGGFSPGVAARLRAADGSRLFVKAASSEPNPTTPRIHRREILVASRLPAAVPAPRLLWWLDEGEPGWVLLAFEEVPGANPVTPWRPEQIARVMSALTELGAALTPSPLDPDTVGSAARAFGSEIRGWQRLRDEPPPHRPLDPWSTRHLEELALLEAGAADAAAGDTLLHFDLRADNMMLTGDSVWFVDWPHVCVGASWIDGVLFAPSVAMQGGPLPEALLTQLASFRAADPAAVTAVVAAATGFFRHRSLQPPPPGLPTLRAFQAAQAVQGQRWLARRLGWERP